jgi:hypothetical protein
MAGAGRMLISGYRWPSLDHLLAMTDDVGVLQHATLDIPNRSCGYCTDDVGRGLIVATEAARHFHEDRDSTRLMSTYLAYLHDAQQSNGWFHNFMGYDRRWQDRSGSGSPDAVGRAIWGIGYAERFAPRPSWSALASEMRRSALEIIPGMEHLRSRTYAALGLAHAVHSRPDDELVVRAVLDEAVRPIADAYDAHRAPDWEWCEDEMTYDDARLPEALLRAGAILANERYIEAALTMLRFYTEVTIEDGIFNPVGSDGWYRRGGSKARFAQQPLEAAGLVDAALAAHDHTGDAIWREVAQIAHGWYLGKNVGHISLVNDGGCCDGLEANGPNRNQGAESTICYLMSAIALANRSSSALRVAQ